MIPKKRTIARPLHIGKSSCGWKFLFYEVNKGFCEFDSELEIHTFKDWKNYLLNTDNIIILDEYDEEIKAEKLLELIEEKQKISNKDDFIYSKNVEGYRFTNSEFY